MNLPLNRKCWNQLQTLLLKHSHVWKAKNYFLKLCYKHSVRTTLEQKPTLHYQR